MDSDRIEFQLNFSVAPANSAFASGKIKANNEYLHDSATRGRILQAYVRHGLKSLAQEHPNDKRIATLVHKLLGSYGPSSAEHQPALRFNQKLDYDEPVENIVVQETDCDEWTVIESDTSGGEFRPSGQKAACEVLSGTARLERVRSASTEQVLTLLQDAINNAPRPKELDRVGFGQLVDAIVRLVKNERKLKRMSPAQSSPVSRFGYQLTLDSDWAYRALDAGVAEGTGSDIRISGALIKESLMQNVRRSVNSPSMELALDKVVFTDALWSIARPAKRSRPLPLSIAIADTPSGECIALDASGYKDAIMIDCQKSPVVLNQSDILASTDTSRIVPLVYRPGWSDRQKKAAEQAFGSATLRPLTQPLQYLRNLQFAQGKINNTRSPDSATELADQVWLGDIDLSAVDAVQQGAVLKLLRKALVRGDARMGQAQVGAKFEECASPHELFGRKPLLENNTVRLMLVSPARLLPNNFAIPGTNSYRQLQNYYLDYFHHASKGLLQLDCYYASQRMVGGALYYQRYLSGQSQYRPEFMTEEGSVFVLEPTVGADLRTLDLLLRDWACRGLPNARARDGAHVGVDPFARENGYGEVWLDYPLLAPCRVRADRD